MDKRCNFTDNLYKSEVAKLNGHVTSGLPRPLMVEITYDLFLGRQISLITRKRYTDRKLGSANQMMILYLCLVASPSGDFRVRSVFTIIKTLITHKGWEMDEDCLQNPNSKPGSAYRKISLSPTGKKVKGDARICLAPLATDAASKVAHAKCRKPAWGSMRPSAA